MRDDHDTPQRYRAEFTDIAQTDAENAYLWRSQQTSPDEALRWFEGVFEAAARIAEAPRRYAIVETTRYEGEIRRYLYQHKRTIYRIVYRVIEPAEDETHGVVRILRVQHSARPLDDEG